MCIQYSTRGTGDDVVVVFKTKLDIGYKKKMDSDFKKKLDPDLLKKIA